MPGSCEDDKLPGKVGDLNSVATGLLKMTLLHDVRGFTGSSVTTALLCCMISAALLVAQ